MIDATTGEELFILKGHSDQILCLAFSPDGKRIATGSFDKTVKIWDAATGQELLTLRGHSDIVTRVLFSPDGLRLVSRSADERMRIWDATPRP
jgi:WD40 repeat protein